MGKITSRPDSKRDTTPVVELRDVHKAFDGLVVLDGLDLALERGRTTVIIGESGAGKSVILKHMVRLIHPDRGEVYYEGRRIDNLPERTLSRIRPGLGFLFQLNALFDSMTVGQNVAFPLIEHLQMKPKKAAEVAEDKLRMVGLGGIHHKWPTDLSGGQKKRVALARAIAVDPKVILYDEPTTGLDPPRADVINELIRKLQRELSVTSVVVTHDLTSAKKVGDRILMLRDGKFIFDGTPQSIMQCLDRRVSDFVAGRAAAEDLDSLNEGARR
jgi:phospholipid/cholesterol/gamma-HCH transport system ATP-binding protein